MQEETPEKFQALQSWWKHTQERRAHTKEKPRYTAKYVRIKFSVVHNYKRQFIGAQSKIRSKKTKDKQTNLCIYWNVCPRCAVNDAKGIVAETVTHVKSTGDSIFAHSPLFYCNCLLLLILLCCCWCCCASCRCCCPFNEVFVLCLGCVYVCVSVFSPFSHGCSLVSNFSCTALAIYLESAKF